MCLLNVLGSVDFVQRDGHTAECLTRDKPLDHHHPLRLSRNSSRLNFNQAVQIKKKKAFQYSNWVFSGQRLHSHTKFMHLPLLSRYLDPKDL